MMNQQTEGVNVTNFQNESTSGSGSDSDLPPHPGGVNVDSGDLPEDEMIEDIEDTDGEPKQNHESL